jgi:hypothetical protein
MERFLERQRDRIVGVLSGPDRVLFRGTLASIRRFEGMAKFVRSQGVLYKEFGSYARSLSEAILARARDIAARAGRPLQYVTSTRVSKEDLVRQIMERDGITRGLICVLTCVEPCQTYTVRKNRSTRRLELAIRESKCTHVYYYWIDRAFGLMHIRLQSWLPFPLQICVNGREWLARRLDEAGIGYRKRDNCFVGLDDFQRAQGLFDEFQGRRWFSSFNALARRVNPWLEAKACPRLENYYWTIRQDEYATDVVFKDAGGLAEVYPRLLDHAIRNFASRDIMRFLGRRTNSRFSGEATSDVRVRPEGIRIKHWVEENSIKMYDKQGCVLRIETTINNPRRFRVRRAVTREGKRCVQWVTMRKSVADMPRRMDIARGANERYLEALAVVGEVAPVRQVLDPVSQGKTQDGRRYRALRPVSREEARVFEVLLRGEFLLQGFRNRDVRERLFPTGRGDSDRRRKNAGRITRLLRLLRAHGLIAKVSRTRYYRLTQKGRQVMSTALNLREHDTSRLVA